MDKWVVNLVVIAMMLTAVSVIFMYHLGISNGESPEIIKLLLGILGSVVAGGYSAHKCVDTYCRYKFKDGG